MKKHLFFAASAVALTCAAELPLAFLSENSQWVPGWRDAGTSDTKPRIISQGASPALEMWYPNSQEYTDCRLAPGADGKAWKALGAEYLSFKVRSETSGDMKIRLAQGDHRWKQNKPF